MSSNTAAVRDPGLQPERTALSWWRTILSSIAADVFIWRGWFHALTTEERVPAGLFESGYSTHVIGLGVCAIVAVLTTVVLVMCAVTRIRLLHAGVVPLARETDIAVQTLTLRTASTAIVALAVVAVFSIALGM